MFEADSMCLELFDYVFVCSLFFTRKCRFAGTLATPLAFNVVYFDFRILTISFVSGMLP